MTGQGEPIQKIKTSNKIFFWIASVSVFCFFMGLQIWRNVEQQKVLKEELAQAQTNYANVQIQQIELNNMVDMLNNEDYVLKLARDRAYFSFSNEIIFTIPEENSLLKQEKLREESEQK